MALVNTNILDLVVLIATKWQSMCNILETKWTLKILCLDHAL